MTQDIERRMPAPAPAAAPDFLSQSTAVEQSRAVAQVLAAYQRADARPRSIDAAVTEMRTVCSMKALAERAFFSYNRGDGNVTGPTIHLARELARIWGNLDYGLVEMRRDDPNHYSEMQAFATDLQTNVRVSTSFTVPHKRDRKKGQAPAPLTDLRDIYENNSNMGSRRVRSQLYAVLPKWFTDEAEALCRQTLESGTPGQKPSDRITEAVTAFARIGVSQARLEARVGRPAAQWTLRDVADLEVVYNTISRREQSADEAFPEPGATADEIRQQAAAARKSGGQQAPAVEDPPDWPEVAQPGTAGGEH